MRFLFILAYSDADPYCKSMIIHKRLDPTLVPDVNMYTLLWSYDLVKYPPNGKRVLLQQVL